MRRIPLYIIIIALVFVAPVSRVNVGALRPVEVVCVYKEDGRIVIETDTGDRGRGQTAIQALSDMKETAPTVIYLDTAQFLLVETDAQAEADTLRKYLKSSVRVCLTQGKVSTQDAAKYLLVHGDLPKLRHWKPGDSVPILTAENIFQKTQN